MIWIMLFLSFWLFQNPSEAKRHIIFWDRNISPRQSAYLKDHVLNVKIGDFLDILCPQSSLMDKESLQKQPLIFDLFNVTKNYLKTCRRPDQLKLIFSCDQPERENKLTIKFQLISPSPFGFSFQYCTDYYFIAIPRDKRKWGSSCQNENLACLHIRTFCEKETPLSPSIRNNSQQNNLNETVKTERNQNIYNPLSTPPKSEKNAFDISDPEAIYKNGCSIPTLNSITNSYVLILSILQVFIVSN